MNQSHGPDPLEELRAVNPVSDDDLPSASLARVRARMQETVMNDDRTRTPQRSRLLGLGVLGAAGALALVLVAGQFSPAPLAPTPSQDTGSAACVELYSLDTLANRAFAFDGTVKAIDGDTVTFNVNEAYRGGGDGTLSLQAPGMTGTAITSAGGPNLEVGERYLVAGDAQFAWGCGYTQPWSAAVAADWAVALGG